MLGILTGDLVQTSLFTAMLLACISVLVLTALFFLNSLKYNRNLWFAMATYTSILSLGYVSVAVHQHTNYKSHFTHISDTTTNNLRLHELQITELLKPNAFNNRYLAKIKRIDQTPVFGTVLLNIAKQDSVPKLSVDDKLHIYGSIQALQPPLNPYQFNYKRYLERHQVYAQLYSQHKQIYKHEKATESVFGLAHNVRSKLNQALQAYQFKPSELAVINALFLGQRQQITTSLYTNYVNAGAIHILAISGLHIGIILFLLKWLFTPLLHLKNGKYLVPILILMILWSYAIIAGLSPSILRAVTMFSVLTIGMYLNRPNNIYNTLAISAFLILIINPLMLFEIGFQLSYLAVLGIVAVYPLIYNPLKTKYRFLNKIWALIAVSLAAQIGIFPLSIFYFNQFPGLFLLTNLFIIPALGFILGYGLFIFLLALLGAPKSFLSDFFGQIISWMNSFFGWVAQQETFVFKALSFNLIMVISLYIVFILAVQYVLKKSFFRLQIAVLAIFGFQIVYIGNTFLQQSKKELVIFHKTRHSLIGFRDGQNLKVFHDLGPIKNQSSQYPIKDYRVGNFIKTVAMDSIKNVYTFYNKKLLVIDSLGIYKGLSFKPDYVLLRQSPKINLNRMLDSLQPKLLIADGSNYKTVVVKWAETCKKKKRLFHYTGEKGAFTATWP
ncbi:ComEC/Rec2 family competence protein [Bizionia sediminis]|uniref:ComEC/Rec2 family competence protein n=1 Tax=Bizionia sediminis TaxID=1737064 RepID=A0ABW5KWJ8_9FLAO